MYQRHREMNFKGQTVACDSHQMKKVVANELTLLL